MNKPKEHAGFDYRKIFGVPLAWVPKKLPDRVITHADVLQWFPDKHTAKRDYDERRDILIDLDVDNDVADMLAFSYALTQHYVRQRASNSRKGADGQKREASRNPPARRDQMDKMIRAREPTSTVAERLRCSRRTVERRRQELIREAHHKGDRIEQIRFDLGVSADVVRRALKPH